MILKANIKRYYSDWILEIVLFVYFITFAEHAKPFSRQFSINDPTINHPFSNNERINSIKCISIAFFVPLVTILTASFIKRSSKQSNNDKLQLIHNSILGLVLSITITGVLTDLLKNWISRPRPDFIARCAPVAGTPIDTLVNVDVCTAPMGEAVLLDGLRSTPSGHTSISFSGLLYLSYWIMGQFKVFKKTTPIYKLVLGVCPCILAVYIGLTRTQDYRHHFGDVFLGMLIGSFWATVIYLKFFPSIFIEDSDKCFDIEDAKLPIYTNEV